MVTTYVLKILFGTFATIVEILILWWSTGVCYRLSDLKWNKVKNFFNQGKKVAAICRY